MLSGRTVQGHVKRLLPLERLQSPPDILVDHTNSDRAILLDSVLWGLSSPVMVHTAIGRL